MPTARYQRRILPSFLRARMRELRMISPEVFESGFGMFRRLMRVEARKKTFTALFAELP